CALRGQQAIRRRSAHRKEVASTFLCKVGALMPLQGFDERGEIGDESFGADAVGGVPDQEERVLDVWPVVARVLKLRWVLSFLRMVEEPHRVLAIVSCRCRKGIQKLAFLLDSRCLAILRNHVLK